MTPSQVAAKIGARQIGPGRWISRCTSSGHDDRTPSMVIGTGDDGRVLIYCHAQCYTEDIISGAGLEMSDLFIDDPVHQWRPGSRTPRSNASIRDFGSHGERLFRIAKRINQIDREMKRIDDACLWLLFESRRHMSRHDAASLDEWCDEIDEKNKASILRLIRNIKSMTSKSNGTGGTSGK